MLKIILSFIAGAGLAAVGFIANSYLSEVPDSVLTSEQASAAGAAMKEDLAPHLLELLRADITAKREIIDQYFFGPRIAKARELYAVSQQPLTIDGVYTEVFEPADGVKAENVGRVLINLHGGAFSLGARTEGRLESIPLAYVAGMKIVSIDYRQGPEHRFPAASEDVATVYRHLLKTYAPENIGIFGCSAGGILTAQAVAWFDDVDLPIPGAIGIFCAGAGQVGVGDSEVIADTFGTNLVGGDAEYFEGKSWSEPLIAPMHHPELMAKFPPTLVISSTRDFAMSSALYTHQQILANGGESELHIYEGLRHYFYADTDLPESRQAFDVMAEFFQRRLATPQQPDKLVDSQ